MKCIEITVSPTRQTSVQTKGFECGECRDASRFIEAALSRLERIFVLFQRALCAGLRCARVS